MFIAQKLHTRYNSSKDSYTHSCHIHLSSWRTYLATVIIPEILNILPNGKSSSDLNLILCDFFLYSIGSPPFIVSI